VQIGEVGSAGIAASVSRGEPLELFWILDDIGSAEALVAKNGSGINSVKDLKGKKIAMPFNSTTHFHTMVALQQAGVNPADVQILNMRPPEVRAAWQRGDIQATFIWDPVLAEVKKDGKVILTSARSPPTPARPRSTATSSTRTGRRRTRTSWSSSSR
jgi:taurine transport system substrate-binding protein